MIRNAFLACAGLLAPAASGHDYWLAPAPAVAPPGAKIDVRLYRGEPLLADDERPLEVDKTTRFRLFSTGGELDLLKAGAEGQTPVARATPEKAGGYLVVMERPAQPNVLDAGEFTAYLKEEGLDAIIARRAELGESKADGREHYSRCLKALIRVGNARDETYRRAVGQALEIIPEADPASLKPGDVLPVRVLFEGHPLAGARVTAYGGEPGSEPEPQSLTTDAEGRVSVEIGRKGTWLIRLVHMRRAAPGGDVDWESFWSAYTFGL